MWRGEFNFFVLTVLCLPYPKSWRKLKSGPYSNLYSSAMQCLKIRAEANLVWPAGWKVCTNLTSCRSEKKQQTPHQEWIWQQQRLLMHRFLMLSLTWSLIFINVYPGSAPNPSYREGGDPQQRGASGHTTPYQSSWAVEGVTYFCCVTNISKHTPLCFCWVWHK